ncbi:hypothetical protein [Amphibacillus jilinensis]|uniref:hypothetical protein n=1 Tax=Amphibacillus jilinensis TaxID=1216008 RepID=UPI001181901C|nr:hypothetical protein [Amphibacillus jilinensis]
MKRIISLVCCLLCLTSCQQGGYQATKLFISPIDDDHYLITIDAFKGQYETKLIVEEAQIFEIKGEVESGDVLFELYSLLNEEPIFTGYIDSETTLVDEVCGEAFSGEYRWVIQSSRAEVVKIEMRFTKQED